MLTLALVCPHHLLELSPIEGQTYRWLHWLVRPVNSSYVVIGRRSFLSVSPYHIVDAWQELKTQCHKNVNQHACLLHAWASLFRNNFVKIFRFDSTNHVFFLQNCRLLLNLLHGHENPRNYPLVYICLNWSLSPLFSTSNSVFLHTQIDSRFVSAIFQEQKISRAFDA